jgi:hypothetical protein
MNSAWHTLRLIVTYTPGGEEAALEQAPDYRLMSPGSAPSWVQDLG